MLSSVIFVTFFCIFLQILWSYLIFYVYFFLTRGELHSPEQLEMERRRRKRRRQTHTHAHKPRKHRTLLVSAIDEQAKVIHVSFKRLIIKWLCKGDWKVTVHFVYRLIYKKWIFVFMYLAVLWPLKKFLCISQRRCLSWYDIFWN